MKETDLNSLKKVNDTLARAAFLFETLVKLKQTGDHSDLAAEIHYAVVKDFDLLAIQMKETYYGYSNKEDL